MTAIVLRGDAAHLPLPDASVDLLLCSPPYWSLRSYADNGEHYAGQIGSEETPAEYVAALLRCTREWVRVLKPGGSLFVNLGDKYAGGGQGGNVGGHLNGGPHLNRTPAAAGTVPDGFREKSLIGLPARYMLGCIDDLGLILRRDIIWHKTNPLPESVEDRCPSAHEYLFHFVQQPRYYSAVDDIREPHAPGSWAPNRHGRNAMGGRNASLPRTATGEYAGPNPLGKIPGSVWEIPTEPLIVPDRIAHARCCGGRKRPGCEDGLSHYAAWPTRLARQIIAGWSPPGICVECGEGRRPVVDKPGLIGGDNNPDSRNGTRKRSTMDGGSREWARRQASLDRIAGYACACTPFTDHPGTLSHRPVSQPRSVALGNGIRDNPGGGYGNAQRTGPWREYGFARWTPPPTRPALIVDVFGGTGTSAAVADVLGRTGITLDRSADYCRLATWRTSDPAERARALGVPKPPPVMDGQFSFDDLESA